MKLNVYQNMIRVICSNSKINVYRNVLNITYKSHKINYSDLKKCIKQKWKNVKFIDIIIQNNQFNLQICCDEHYESNIKKYFEVVDKQRKNIKTNDDVLNAEEYLETDVSFVKVARELNEWHIGPFILEKISVLSNEYDCGTDVDIDLNKSTIIPLGVPISRINEFYGVRGL